MSCIYKLSSRPSIQVFKRRISNQQVNRNIFHSNYIPIQTTSQLKNILYNHCLNLIASRSFMTMSTGLQYSSMLEKFGIGSPSPEKTKTDFKSLDILANSTVPSTSIDACLWDGFHLNSGVKATGGTGLLLVGGAAFSWKPWVARRDGQSRLLNEKGQWEVEDEVWGVFEISWPRPGLGKQMWPLSPKTVSKIYSLGIRVEIQDTRNAAAQFNLLATERGISNISAAMIPIGWREGVGIRQQ